MNSYLVGISVWLYLSGVIMTAGYLTAMDEHGLQESNAAAKWITAYLWPVVLIVAWLWFFVEKLKGR